MLWAWGLAGALGVGVAAWAWPRGQAQRAAALPAWLLLILGLGLAATLQGLALGLGWRWGAWALGLALGGAVGAWGALGRGGESEGRPLGAAAHLAGLSLVALAATGAAFLEEPIQAANAAIGLIAAWGMAELVGWGARPARPSGSPLALAWLAGLAAAVVWAPSAGGGAAQAAAYLPLAAASVPLAWAAAAKGEGPALPIAGALVAALAGLAAAWAGGGGLGPAAWAIAGVCLLAGLLAATLPAGPLRGPAAWGAVALTGLVLLLLGRAGGFAAMAAGVLLLGAATGGRGGLGLWAVVGTVLAGRTWLQLYLARTDLVGYGMDLTHPYAHAGLWVGALVVGLAASLRAGLGVAQGACLGLGLSAAPVLLGYAWHPEALGAMLVGLALGAAFSAGQSQAPEGEALPDALALAPGFALGGVALSLMAAPWLVSAMQAPRGVRATVLGLALILALGWLGWRAVGQPKAQA